MHVAYFYNDSAEDPAGHSEDADPEQSPVVAALRRLGHDVCPFACTPDLAAVRDWLAAMRPEVVFNRVESLGGSDALAPAVPMLLDALRIPYTGCAATQLYATADKVAVKKRLVLAGLPTPAWAVATGDPAECGLPAPRRPRFILKPILEHASFAMGDDSLFTVQDDEQLCALIKDCETRWGRPYFAEQFIDGREFNLSLLGDEPTLLPPAEIDFSAFPSGKPRIVGQRAKFDAGSFEFHNTPRRFDFPETDRPLLRRLKQLAMDCWRIFDLSGYARVDFRVDHQGQPWILEINANPCLAPESGFAAALARVGIEYDEAIQLILKGALRRAAGTRADTVRRNHPAVVDEQQLSKC